MHFVKRGFALTKLDVALQCEQDVARFQVSVNDVVLMEVDEGLQSLLTHGSDLRLCQRPLQFCTKTQKGKHTHISPYVSFNIYGLLQEHF